MKPAPQSEEALQNASMACEESLQPCSDQARGSTRDRACAQEPRAAQKAASPCANLLDSERDTAQLEGFRALRLGYTFLSPREAG